MGVLNNNNQKMGGEERAGIKYNILQEDCYKVSNSIETHLHLYICHESLTIFPHDTIHNIALDPFNIGNATIRRMVAQK
jgi:hypothetical protein